MPLKGLLKTLRFIYSHPLNRQQALRAIVRFFRWQIGTRLLPYAVVVPFAQKSKLLLYRGLTGATQNLYCGLHDFEDMAFLLHFLREEDQFVDVGANVGGYSILAAGEVGAKTIAIEPIPDTFKHLCHTVALNEISTKVKPLNIGLGSKHSRLHFTKHLDTTNHVAQTPSDNTIAVEVRSFDEIINIEQPTLVKIDVEGFETEVLKGMATSLSHPDLQAIIIELNGSGKRYGYEDAAIHQQLLNTGFQPYHYLPFERRLQPRESFGEEKNTIYLKDPNFAIQRVQTAPQILIHGQAF
jgi:FkbM family methyltransferase